MAAGSCRIDSSAVPDDLWIHPVVVHVAVKDLEPGSTGWEADLVLVFRRVREAGHDDDIAAHAGNPSLKRQDTVLVVHVDQGIAFGAKRGIAPAHADEFAREPQEIAHRGIVGLETGP